MGVSMPALVPLLLLLAAAHSPSVAVPPTPSSCWRRDRELATPLGPLQSGGSPPTPPRPLFQPGDCFADGRASVCYRIPALIAAGNRTLLAFAKAMNYSGDQCYPMPFWCAPPRPTLAQTPTNPGALQVRRWLRPPPDRLPPRRAGRQQLHDRLQEERRRR